MIPEDGSGFPKHENFMQVAQEKVNEWVANKMYAAMLNRHGSYDSQGATPIFQVRDSWRIIDANPNVDLALPQYLVGMLSATPVKFTGLRFFAKIEAAAYETLQQQTCVARQLLEKCKQEERTNLPSKKNLSTALVMLGSTPSSIH